MRVSHLLLVIVINLLVSPAVLANAQISGVVRNDLGRALANITVVLTASGESATELTDAYGRYQFTSLDGGNYQIRYEDQNFIHYTDEDPFPDEGTLYINFSQPAAISLQENQNLNISDVVLQRVATSDNRQASLTVTDCLNFGDTQSPQTLAYALGNAREIFVECGGTLKVPELIIGKDVKISATTDTAFEARGNNRVIRVLPGISFEISGVDITGGKSYYGSGVYNTGITTINDADIKFNTGDTAVVINFGVLNLERIRQYQNVITYDSVFRNTGVITGHDVTIESHTSSAGPVLTNDGNIELKQCRISGLGTNNVYAVNNNAGSVFKLFDCTLTGNSSLFLNEGTLEIYDSSLDSNDGDQGVIDSSGVLKIGGTGITNNNVYGTVIYNDGLADILNSTISGNSAGVGVFGNAANVDNFRGVVSNEGLMRISSSTIANNQHRGYTDRQIGNAGELQLSNTILQGTGNGDEVCGGVVPIVSLGHSLHSDGTCGATVQSDIPFGNPGLVALADNGGLGKTHALQEGSDAIDAGNCNDGTLFKDQRGVPRPQGRDCDIGAFELVATGSDNTGDPDNSAGSDDNTNTGGDSENGSPDADNNPDNDTTGTNESSATNGSVDNSDNTGADESEDQASDGTATFPSVDDGAADAGSSSSVNGGGGAVGPGVLLLAFLMRLFTRRQYQVGLIE